MGLTATTFSQMLPDELTHHMRVGPGYVRAAAVDQLGGAPSETGTEPTLVFLRRIYPATVGRPLSDEEATILQKAADAAQRHVWVHTFLCSAEYRRRAGEAGRPLPPSPLVHWSRWPEPWRERVKDLGGEDFSMAHDGNPRAFLRALYGELLDRAPSDAELDGWSTLPSGRQRRRWVEILLDHRLEKGEAGFTAPDLASLRLWM
jgi:hypothetical protein